MSDAAPRVSTPPRRSPSYPSLSLREALERLKLLYKAEGLHAAPIETAVRHWGYKGPNGRTNLIVSALKKYGLIVDSGSGRARKIQVTEAARRILEHPDPDERQAAIQKAALLPPIHSEMWRKYRLALPTDETWVWELREDRDFTDSGARDFVREYRETIRFAGLGREESPETGSVPSQEGESTDSEELSSPAVDDHISSPNTLPQLSSHLAGEGQLSASALQTYPIPVALHGKPPVQITGSFPLSETEWNQFIAVLSAMKPVLVEAAETFPGVVD
ncbi:hypothetical protein [Agromyces humi]|uniref:hypothetical protein n=1 Tax=Agromyces humi TaxID=1766800 RepID=UPI0013571970|nr:hypothetical protein [Agromyces humi]